MLPSCTLSPPFPSPPFQPQLFDKALFRLKEMIAICGMIGTKGSLFLAIARMVQYVSKFSLMSIYLFI
jgi:hypothetical protein